MGGVVSTGQDNDDLIDNLKEAEYIKTAKVEQVFRIVDRAHYYLPESRDSAYKDIAWKSGTLHLSAPCIYSEVMEALELSQGLSFLNLGSGTGYLNTMVGFMTGPHGINHGIEMHAENVKYAYERLKEFKQTAKKFDDLEFCEPVFVEGNCLNLAPDNRRYDRVYCGAACPPDLKSTLQNLIKLNGILVMPVGDQLLKVKRISETEFTADNVLPVSFASLYVPPDNKDPADIIVMPEVNPVSLQNQCASVVRDSIRKNFCFDIPASKDASSKQSKKFQATKLFQQENVRLPLNFLPTAQRLMIMSAFGQSDDSNTSDVDDQTDESYLDLQLQRHAQERNRVEERMRRQRQKENTDEVDSSLSDDEMNELQQHVKVRQTGYLQSVSEDIESMESEDGIVADDEEDEEDDFETEMRDMSGILGNRRKKTASNSEKGNDNTSKIKNNDNSNVNKVSTVENKPETSSAKGGKSSAKPDLFLSSDEEHDSAGLAGVSTGAIRFVKSSNPRGYKTSYSTSAEASETSGFGSLGEDIFHIGSLQSSSVFLDEDDDITDEASYDAGVFTNMNEDRHRDPKSPLDKFHVNGSKRSNRQKKMIEEEEMDENEDNNNESDDHDTSTDEEEVSSSEEESCERKGRQELSEPRGPDFTTFLKAKVDTLPIPNSLKKFILRYR